MRSSTGPHQSWGCWIAVNIFIHLGQLEAFTYTAEGGIRWPYAMVYGKNRSHKTLKYWQILRFGAWLQHLLFTLVSISLKNLPHAISDPVICMTSLTEGFCRIQNVHYCRKCSLRACHGLPHSSDLCIDLPSSFWVTSVFTWVTHPRWSISLSSLSPHTQRHLNTLNWIMSVLYRKLSYCRFVDSSPLWHLQTLCFSSPLTKTWRPFPPTSCHAGSLPHFLWLIPCTAVLQQY